MFKWCPNAVNFGVFRKIAIIIPMAALTFETQARGYTNWQLDHADHLLDTFIKDIRSDILNSFGQDENGNTKASLIGSSTSISNTPDWLPTVTAQAHTRTITVTFGAQTVGASPAIARGTVVITAFEPNCTTPINRNTDPSPENEKEGVCFKCTSVTTPNTFYGTCTNPATLSDSKYFATCPACSAL